MRFWDSSAVVPLLVAERTSSAVAVEYERDPAVVVWWATEVECLSALARLERDGDLPGPSLAEAVARLDRFAQAWTEVEPVPAVRRTCRRLLRTHHLRAADAFQLAAALAVAEDHPATLPIVTLDERFAEAAGREGFPVTRPGAM